MKTNWSEAAYQLSRQGQAYVIVTLIGVSGSTPRNSGSKMIIAKEALFDTVGGGRLEHEIVKFANNLLLAGDSCQHLKQFDLGIHMDQCCGGSTNVLFECFAQTRVNIMLFGAGHVGRALLPILATLPCKIVWVDSRGEQFPNDISKYSNVEKIVSEKPQLEVEKMPIGSFYIVLTHKHQLDYDICCQIFERDDFSYFGLIGSKTKWRRFQRRFKQQGISLGQLDRVSCPIGSASVSGKLPAEIAVSIASELIAKYNRQKNEAKPTRVHGVSRKLMGELLK